MSRRHSIETFVVHPPEKSSKATTPGLIGRSTSGKLGAFLSETDAAASHEEAQAHLPKLLVLEPSSADYCRKHPLLARRDTTAIFDYIDTERLGKGDYGWTTIHASST